jgi:transcriptional regulator with XRE-family HTH domain
MRGFSRCGSELKINSLDSVVSGLRPVSRPVHGWLRAVRQALGRSRASVSGRLHLSPQAIQGYEKAEKDDAITLATLRRAAAAHDPAQAHLRATEHSMALEAQASGDLPALRRPVS